MQICDSYMKAYGALDLILNKKMARGMSERRLDRLLKTAYAGYVFLVEPGEMCWDNFKTLVLSYKLPRVSAKVDIQCLLESVLRATKKLDW